MLGDIVLVYNVMSILSLIHGHGVNTASDPGLRVSEPIHHTENATTNALKPPNDYALTSTYTGTMPGVPGSATRRLFFARGCDL